MVWLAVELGACDVDVVDGVVAAHPLQLREGLPEDLLRGLPDADVAHRLRVGGEVDLLLIGVEVEARDLDRLRVEPDRIAGRLAVAGDVRPLPIRLVGGPTETLGYPRV